MSSSSSGADDKALAARHGLAIACDGPDIRDSIRQETLGSILLAAALPLLRQRRLTSNQRRMPRDPA